MKSILACITAGFLMITGVNAQTTTTTVTTSSGTITQYTPGSTFIVKETSGPVTYTYGDQVVYATSSGVVLTPEQVQARIRVGIPVNVEYAPVGETRVIKRVIVEEDDDDDDDDN